MTATPACPSWCDQAEHTEEHGDGAEPNAHRTFHASTHRRVHINGRPGTDAELWVDQSSYHGYSEPHLNGDSEVGIVGHFPSYEPITPTQARQLAAALLELADLAEQEDPHRG